MPARVLIRTLRAICNVTVLSCALGACSRTTETTPADEAPMVADHEPATTADVLVRLVSQTEALDLTKSGAAVLFLDVRTAGEFASGHVPGALNIPIGDLGERLAELEDSRDGEIIVYCEVGGRARKAESLLKQAGFRQLGHLEGDMGAWRSAGLATE